MVGEPDLAAENDAVTELATTRNSNLRDDDAVATDDHVVTNLDQIRIALDNWSNGLTCYSYNNLKISLDVSDGPETSLDTEETSG